MAEQYTSEQYKYMLMRLLMRHFRMSNDAGRYYTRQFFWQLFDGITVDAASYQKFADQLDSEMEFCAENNYVACESIPDSVINEHGLLLVECFAAIGIELVISTENDTATFTKPDGTVMVYAVSASTNYFYINSKSGQEIAYAKACAPYYNGTNAEPLELADCNFRECGPGCYWDYDADTKTMTVSGSGKCTVLQTDAAIGAGAYNTLVLGADVSGLAVSAINVAACATVVFLQAADAEIALTQGNIGTTQTKDVYADNEIVRAHAWPSKWTVTIHTLAEWEG